MEGTGDKGVTHLLRKFKSIVAVVEFVSPLLNIPHSARFGVCKKKVRNSEKSQILPQITIYENIMHLNVSLLILDTVSWLF